MSHESLTPAETERLEMLAEECAEVVQMCTKILRHGYSAHHPSDPDYETNRSLLEKELGQLVTVASVASAEGDFDMPVAHIDIWRHRLRWTHHQRPLPEKEKSS